jgi:hypothetical protein
MSRFVARCSLSQRTEKWLSTSSVGCTPCVQARWGWLGLAGLLLLWPARSGVAGHGAARRSRGLETSRVSQISSSDCEIIVEGKPRRVTLADGRSLTVDAQAVGATDRYLIALGSHAHLWSKVDVAQTVVDEGTVIGFVRDRLGTRAVTNPLPGQRVLYPRVVSAGLSAWHVLFVTAPHLGNEEPEIVDSATIWQGIFDLSGWRDVRPIASARRASLQSNISSALVKAGTTLNFAYTFAFDDDQPSSHRGGVVLLRLKDGLWFSDTLRTWRKATYVRLAKGLTNQSLILGLVQPYFDGHVHASSLFLTRYDAGWSDLRLVAEHVGLPLYNPVLMPVGHKFVAAWVVDAPQADGRRQIESVYFDDRLVVSKPLRIATGDIAEQYDGLALGERRVLWFTTRAETPEVLSVVMQEYEGIRRLGKVFPPLSGANLRAIPLSGSTIALITSRIGQQPSEPRAATYVSRLTLRCKS